MRFLCLAYGAEKDWVVLSKQEQDELLAQDEVLRARGDLVEAVGTPTTVTAWDGNTTTSDQPFGEMRAPLAGFSVIEAGDLDEAVELVSKTPCAVARGAIEVRPILDLGGNSDA